VLNLALIFNNTVAFQRSDFETEQFFEKSKSTLDKCPVFSPNLV